MEEEQQMQDSRNIGKILDYFEEQESDNAIPEWALDFSQDIINKAKEKYKKRRKEEEESRYKWKGAVKFVLEHKGFPTNFYELDYEKRMMFREAIELHKEGRLESEAEEEEKEPEDEEPGDSEVSEEDRELPKRRFYHADELSPEQRGRLINLYGYRCKPFIYRDGTSGNNLIIKNDGKSESDYHFCMKHLFAEIDKANSETEYKIGNLKADVAYVYTEGKIAVEIETGSNKQQQVEEKTAWLNQHFNHWIFVCSRKNKNRYKQYVDNKKSFCLTLKEADRKVEELTSEINGSYAAAEN